MTTNTTTQKPQQVKLTAETTLSEAISLLGRQQTSYDTLVEWAQSTPLGIGPGEVSKCFGSLIAAGYASSPQDGAKVVQDMSDVQEAQKGFSEAALKAALAGNGGKITPKVAKRGGISWYGMGRNPMTMYIRNLIDWCDSQLGMDRAAFDATPIGQWVKTNPVRTIEIDKFVAGAPNSSAEKADQALLENIRAGGVPHAKVSGNNVVVSLSWGASN